MFCLKEYQLVFIFSVISFSLAIAILGISYTLSSFENDIEKLSSYECGFDPYEDARNAFDVRFYLVAILFLIFDTETVLLFPWSYSLSHFHPLGFWSLIDFLLELIIGLIYAWKIGSLDWE
uniref:NADH-ubiquinone oxidoreductase chain 3 n=1 Tax=Ishige okamurae TaxID=233772 RepID=A0A4Y5T7P6_9PHAE|nr:NADH dehydrogenase subunit 3 [Ishige okamurae]QDB64178.1 NADH dehydrogenase subunit 3 [Ishige okamurae]WBP70215.1 NADH dehydrogenase subunit 3 [Ishige okamurae]